MIALSQPPAPDTLVSPEVRPDRKVTFRIRAPKAADVAFFGDWMPLGSQEKMTKDAQAASMARPSPTRSIRASTSLVEVPADPPALWQARDVPHGAVEINWEKSKALNGETRVIAGLSMGGGQSIAIGFPHLDLFSAVVPADFETRFAALLNYAKTKLKPIRTGCGRQDSLFPRWRKLCETLDAHHIHHTFRASEGAHTYTVWRLDLGEFAPLLFR